jgi:hypothetical protein
VKVGVQPDSCGLINRGPLEWQVRHAAVNALKGLFCAIHRHDDPIPILGSGVSSGHGLFHEPDVKARPREKLDAIDDPISILIEGLTGGKKHSLLEKQKARGQPVPLQDQSVEGSIRISVSSG